MKATERITELQSAISAGLLPEIKGYKVILLDVPYYSNIGDTLIWQGTHDFLRKHGVKCELTASKDSFKFPTMPKDCVILLQGGGNFGDIWYQHQLFREKVIVTYPDNKIIILPQTIYFREEETLVRDAEILSAHRNLLIVARDRRSFEILKKHYSTNRLMLLPDMAFCIDFSKFRIPKATDNRNLFFERQDVEISPSYDYGRIVPADAERHEWPLIEHPDESWRTRWMERVRRRIPRFYDLYWDGVMRKYYVKVGIQFISKYHTVFTTRLHGAILSFLLGKNVVLFDNAYGKNRTFFESWLSGVDEIKLAQPTEIQ